MEITVRVEVQYLAPENAVVLDVLQMLRRPMWVRFMMRYISPRLKTSSPADKSVLQSLASEWRILPPMTTSGDLDEETQDYDDNGIASAMSPAECVICMADTPRASIDHVRLPCGHAFHFHCVQSWLQLRSTCPVCRFQFKKAFAGTYAVHSLVSTVLLSEEQRALPSREDVLRASVEKQLVRAVVDVTLVKVVSEEKQQEYPCELSALVMHTDGETFSEYDVFAVPNATVPCEPRLDHAKDDSEATTTAATAAAASTPTASSATARDRVGSVRERSSCDLHNEELEDPDNGTQHFKRLRRA